MQLQSFVNQSLRNILGLTELPTPTQCKHCVLVGKQKERLRRMQIDFKCQTISTRFLDQQELHESLTSTAWMQ